MVAALRSVVNIDFDAVVGWSNIIGAVLGLVALMLGALFSWSRFQARALFSRRRRYLLTAVRQAGWNVNRWLFGLSTRELVWRRIVRGGPLIQEEIAWMSSLVGAHADERLPARPRVRVPFHVCGGRG